jgi:hypothetical protein
LHVQYFDGEDCRDQYDDFYEQLVRVKDILFLPFADNMQQLFVKFTREDLGQSRACNWYEGHWTGMDDTAWQKSDIPGARTTWVPGLTGET